MSWGGVREKKGFRRTHNRSHLHDVGVAQFQCTRAGVEVVRYVGKNVHHGEFVGVAKGWVVSSFLQAL